LKAKHGLGWDELVIEAVCTHYGLDRSVLALPRVERPPKAEKKVKNKEEGRVETRCLPKAEG
jgi:hypothetical protein